MPFFSQHTCLGNRRHIGNNNQPEAICSGFASLVHAIVAFIRFSSLVDRSTRWIIARMSVASGHGEVVRKTIGELRRVALTSARGRIGAVRASPGNPRARAIIPPGITDPSLRRAFAAARSGPTCLWSRDVEQFLDEANATLVLVTSSGCSSVLKRLSRHPR